MTSDITAIDNFCGAGGSTTGLKAAGIRVLHAANHWERAIESHNTNHPEINHSCVDLHIEHPARFPKTTVGWFSCECTTHSPAGGRKRRHQNQLHLWEQKAVDPAVERSRMGAWDVVRFTEYHRYQVVLVENVLEFIEWELFDCWLKTMYALGYQHQCVYFNSQFAYPKPVPQSRDRIYIVFHRVGNKKPDVDFRPPGRCPEHGEVRCVQRWKNPKKRSGKYGRRNQYLYYCPHCTREVVPYRTAAREAIDWTLPCPKIGDRKRPLSPATLRRIERGLKRFVTPFVAPGRTDNVPTAIDEPIHTLTASNQQWLVEPAPFLVHRGYATAAEYDRLHSVDEPAPTQTTSAKLYLAQPFIDTARTHNVSTSLDEPTPTLTTGRNLSIIEPPPFITAYHGGRDAVESLEVPMWTVSTNNQFGLVQPEPFISSYYGNGGEASVDNPSPTIRTVQGHALVEPDWSLLVEQCGYRMIQAHEAKLLMGFASDYIILGNQEEQFRQEGNAVCPINAEMLGRAVVESLS